MNNAGIHLSTSEVLWISENVDRLDQELDTLNPSDPFDSARIDSIIAALQGYDHTISAALKAPCRAHLKLVG